MAMPVVIVPSGGLPVTNPVTGIGTPVTEATNGFGVAVTLVVDKPALPVVFVPAVP